MPKQSKSKTTTSRSTAAPIMPKEKATRKTKASKADSGKKKKGSLPYVSNKKGWAFSSPPSLSCLAH